MPDSLKLSAADEEDLAVVSACLQDGLLAFGDMEYLAEEQRFVLVVNRFRWEDENSRDAGDATADFARVHCGICFEGVSAVRLRNLDRKDRSRVLDLLAVKAEGNAIDLLFADRGRVRLEVNQILCHVQDLGDPWPTKWQPRHPVDGDD